VEIPEFKKMKCPYCKKEVGLDIDFVITKPTGILQVNRKEA